jgi:hypothetical protein
MSRTLRVLPLLFLAASLMAGTRIKQYNLSLAAEPNGSGRANATLLLEGCVPGTLVVPIGFSQMKELHADAGPDGWRLEAGTKVVKVTLPEGVPGTCQVAFSFPVAEVFQPPIKPNTGEKPIPAKNRIFRHALLNTQETAIQGYRFELRLAPGYLVQTIREQLPKLGKLEAGPRARLDKVDGRQGAFLQVATLNQGDNTSLVMEITPARKSPLWLLVGIVLAAFYLYYFRDLVARKGA